jgi:hypothetical protein
MRSPIRGIGIVAAVMSCAAWADCAPEKLVRMETQNHSPGIPADSFARKSKIMYRIGNGRTRLEEQHDPADNVQLLIITDAPRLWHIDLVSKSGETAVDDAVPPKVTFPVFSEETLPKEILAIEFGCERQFINDPRTTHERTETKTGVAMKHWIRSGNWKFSILTREGSDRPIGAVLSENDRAVGAIRYVSHQTLETVPEGLFTPPAGIAFRDAIPSK